MSLQTIKDELVKIENAIELIDPAAKAQIENATAAIKAAVIKVADSVELHAEQVKAAVNG